MTDNKETPTKQDEVQVTAGEKLRKAREARKLSQQTIADHLKLKIEVIQAIDEDRHGDLAAPTFVRGYLRAYAAQVGESADEVIACYNRVIGEHVEEHSMKSPRIGKSMGKTKPAAKIVKPARQSKLGIAVVVLGLMLVAGGWWVIQLANNTGQESSSIDPQQTETAGNLPITDKPAATDVIAPPVPGTNVVIPPPKQENKKEEPVQKPTDKTVEEKKTAPEVKKAAPVVAKTPGPAKESQNTLVLRFTTDSWVAVRDGDGKKLLYRLGKKGASYTVSGKTPYQVLLGNAEGVSVEWNGKPYDLTRHTRGKVARFRLGSE